MRWLADHSFCSRCMFMSDVKTWGGLHTLSRCLYSRLVRVELMQVFSTQRLPKKEG